MTIALRPPASRAPEVGQLVVVRNRHWVVSDVARSGLLPDVLSDAEDHPQHLVELTSVEDDGSDDDLRVIWEVERGARVLTQATLPTPVPARLDPPERLDAFLDAVRWGAITSADSRALQAPYRSGITIEDYQLDPVVRALRMPRVNLLIADDVGLGKTIEAGLVLQEMLLRHRARTAWIVCPANLCLKWQSEMVEKFGLDFRIVDAEYVRQLRRTRGVTANPWTSFPRLIVSVDWLKRPRAMGLLREKLPPGAPTYPRTFDLLIIDEVHSVAPAGNGHYATDSLRTQAIREIAPHFEHRLFLSATPHNGHVESFTALLELLDPQRFARGVKPSPEALAYSLVRRLKSELRQTLPPNPDGSPRFAERVIRPLEVEYPEAERQAHADLKAYAASRRRDASSRSAAVAADFVTLLLKKRLFSSPAAFAKTLEVHMATLVRGAKRAERAVGERGLRDLGLAFDRLDEEIEDELELEEATEDALGLAAKHTDPVTTEQHALLQRMHGWAKAARGRPDAKAERLLDWLDDVCRPMGADGARHWGAERVIIFTEYRDTQRWLETLLAARGLGGDRLALLYGGMDPEGRERIKAEFQFDPAQCPLRILLATDAASEGIDLQRHCHRMVHVEIPFNPNRLEQRNGRIDRHGQRAPHVLIHHFVGKGYEDAEPGSFEGDLEFLSRVAKRVSVIRDDLGSAGPVLAQQVEQAMLGDRRRIDERAIEDRGKASRQLQRIERNLREEVGRLRAQLEESRKELRVTPTAVARVVQTGLELGRQAPLVPTTVANLDDASHPYPAFIAPALTSSWARTVTDLAHPVTAQQRPITFDHHVAAGRDDVVLVHLGHRLVDQSMRLLRAEIWKGETATGMSRVTARVVPNEVLASPAVAAHARLVITGGGGHRLHEEVIVAGGYIRGGRFARFESLTEQGAVLGAATKTMPSPDASAAIIGEWEAVRDGLFRALEARAKERADSLARLLADRADEDAKRIAEVMEELRRTIARQLDDVESNAEIQAQLALFEPDERQQYTRDVGALRRRLDEIPGEIERESGAVRERYADPRRRLFPAAVTFLMPERLAGSPKGSGR
jgi:superfamily II DNA or RNA helicase